MANAIGDTTGYPSALVEAAQSALRRQHVILFSVAAALGGFLFGDDTSVREHVR